jgi:hypothetical protein
MLLVILNYSFLKASSNDPDNHVDFYTVARNNNSIPKKLKIKNNRYLSVGFNIEGLGSIIKAHINQMKKSQVPFII